MSEDLRIRQERETIRANNALPITDPYDDLDPELAQAMRDWDAATAASHNRQKAVAAGIVGGIPDLVQLGADALAGALVARSPEIPFTSSDLRKRWGVEGEEMGTILGGFLSPEPTSTAMATKKALLLPMGYVRNGSKKMDELWDAAKRMFSNDEDPGQIYRATGAIRSKNGEILWHKRDTGTIDPTDVRRIAREQLPELGPGEEGFIMVSPRQLLKGDDELFEMFPYLENVQVRLHLKNKGTKQDPQYIYFNERAKETNTLGQADVAKGEIDLFNARAGGQWSDSAVSTLYHELGHQIDAVMGVLPTGGRQLDVTQTYSNLRFSQALKELMDTADEGIELGDWHDAVADPTSPVRQILDEFNIDNKEDFRTLKATYDQYARAVFSGDPELMVDANILRSSTEKALARHRTTMGVIMQEGKFPDLDLNDIDEVTLADLASDRYYRLEGEARQRLNQHLIGRADEEIDAILENYTRTGKAPKGMEQPVDLEQQIVEAPLEVDPQRFTGARQ